MFGGHHMASLWYNIPITLSPIGLARCTICTAFIDLKNKVPSMPSEKFRRRIGTYIFFTWPKLK
jgi:hypothetical protein